VGHRRHRVVDDQPCATSRRRPVVGGSPGEGEVLPEDMSPTSLIGGGLIAGASLSVLYIGIASLIASGAIHKIFGG
jgi:hypothetical protein